MLGVLILAPALTRPTLAIGFVAALVAVWLAWKSVAIPLALSSLPTLVAAVNGTNPLPKGAATFLVAAWVGLSILLVTMRGEHQTALRGLISWPVALAIVLLALMVLRLAGSPGESYGSHKVQLYAADDLVFLIGGVYVGAGRGSLRLFLILTLAVITASALLLIGNLLTGHAHQQYSGRFAISAQEGAINLGRESANGALIAICLILISTRTTIRNLAIAALPVLLVSLVAAGSRGPTVAFLIGLLSMGALTAATGRARRRLLVVAAGLVGAAILIPLVVPGSAVGRSLSTILGSAGGLSSNGRANVWSEAYRTFAQHPLFGIGTGGFSALDPAELYPHNVLLEVAVEVGAFGVVALTAMIVIFLRRLIRLWQHSIGSRQIEVTLLIALFVSSLVNAMFSGAIQDNSDIWLWGGLCLGLIARGEVRRVAPRGRRAA
jgi:O-antigen ligase